MKKYILLIVIVGIGLVACNPNEKEIAEVNDLMTVVEETEHSLFSIDTAKVFAVKKQMELDLKDFNTVNDTLSKEEAFMLGDIFASKKKLFRLEENFFRLMNEIEVSKKQLNDMRQDLESGVMSKEDFKKNFAIENTAIMNLGSQINKSVSGIEVAVQKFELDRPDLLKFLEKRKERASSNE